MKTINIIDGLKILHTYEKPDESYVCAEHDIIYAGPDDAKEVNEEDAERLLALGWDVSEVDRWAAFV